MKIDFLLGSNEYQSTHHFAAGFAKALERAGAPTRVLSLEGNRAKKSFREIQKNPPNLTCSFSDITVGENQPIADLLKIPHLSLLIDPAIYFLHQMTSPLSIVSSVDENDVAFIRSFGFERTFFLPHGVPKELFDIPLEKERPYDVVFLGTCIDIEEVLQGWKKNYSPEVVELLLHASDRVLQEEETSILQALAEAGVDSFDLPGYHHEVDLYTRGKDRIELIKSLAGLKIDVFGGKVGKKGWSHYLGHLLNCRVHKPLPFEKSLKVLSQAKIVLNSSPRFKAGSHERILYALALGAIPLSSKSSYLQKHFQDEKHLLYTSFGAHEGALEKADALLQSADKQRAILERGRPMVLKEHTFDARAKTLLSNCNPELFNFL